jgi:hypothetical protein
VCGSYWGLKKFKMATVAMVTKVQVVSMATAGILKFPSLKTIYTHAIQHFY